MIVQAAYPNRSISDRWLFFGLKITEILVGHDFREVIGVRAESFIVALSQSLFGTDGLLQ